MKRVANTGSLFDDPDTPIKWVEVEEQEDCRCAELKEILPYLHEYLTVLRLDALKSAKDGVYCENDKAKINNIIRILYKETGE